MNQSDNYSTNVESQYGLVGFPLGHSFSRRFFTEKFAGEGINAEYLNFEISNIDELPALLARHPKLRGFNVTIPYKEQIFRVLDEVDAAAAEIGAVNVVKVEGLEDNRRRLTGYNTDVIGFRESIVPYLKPWHTKALVLGTGGASKAVVAGLKMLGIYTTLVSRHKIDGVLTYNELTTKVMADHTVIVNTTPLGMWPKVDVCPDIPYQFLTEQHLCYDVVYNPGLTKFLQLSSERCATIVGGLDMLHRQAVAAWKIWNE